LELYPDKEPDVHAINRICDRINFKICRPQMLEFARRHGCDGERILAFLVRHEELIHHGPRLIWNADEAQLNSLNRSRVSCQNGMLPLPSAMQQLPHITGLVSINADGVVLDPSVILKSVQPFGDMDDLQSHCCFATSTNEWISDGLWAYFALMFAAQISCYRLTLPPEIGDDDMLLIIDGHKTQINLTAVSFLWATSLKSRAAWPHSSQRLDHPQGKVHNGIGLMYDSDRQQV
jgi:hypothetical protein